MGMGVLPAVPGGNNDAQYKTIRLPVIRLPNFLDFQNTAVPGFPSKNPLHRAPLRA
jgi:hypothetical protein